MTRVAPMNALDVSIIIVAHNAREHLVRALSAVCSLGHEVIVVDNASTDGTSELVQTRFPLALASRNRILLPPKTRTQKPASERVLRRRFRPRSSFRR